MKVNYNLKNKVNEEELIICVVTYEGKRIKMSTKRKAYTKSWNTEKQRCAISSDFPDKVNRNSKKINKFLDELEKSLSFHFSTPQNLINEDHVKHILTSYINGITKDELEEDKKKQITPLQFFDKFLNEKRINKQTGTFVNERTTNHHKLVLKRFQSFFKEMNLKDDFSVFDKRFETKFETWAYSSKNYSANTIPTSLSILKVWLNAAVEEGLINEVSFKNYKSKSKEVDNIYLNEDEIKKIYELDIQQKMSEGRIDKKSKIETTRDLFIVGCWTGLRYSDLNNLNKSAVFDLEKNSISVITEKTRQKVQIPLHPYLKEIYLKYEGNFPKMIDKAHSILHLQEIGRLCDINEEVLVTENKGGQITTKKYKKYQLIKNHTSRRSFATNLYLKGASTISIMKLTGHTTEANFMKYIKITRQENLELMQEFFK